MSEGKRQKAKSIRTISTPFRIPISNPSKLHLVTFGECVINILGLFYSLFISLDAHIRPVGSRVVIRVMAVLPLINQLNIWLTKVMLAMIKIKSRESKSRKTS